MHSQFSSIRVQWSQIAIWSKAVLAHAQRPISDATSGLRRIILEFSLLAILCHLLLLSTINNKLNHLKTAQSETVFRNFAHVQSEKTEFGKRKEYRLLGLFVSLSIPTVSNTAQARMAAADSCTAFLTRLSEHGTRGTRRTRSSRARRTRLL